MKICRGEHIVGLCKLLAELVLVQRFGFYREKEHICLAYSRRPTLMMQGMRGHMKTFKKQFRGQDKHGSPKNALAEGSRRSFFIV
jgi:hypothetical protein